MKIGYIGGFKDGEFERRDYQRYHPINLEWIVEKEDHSKREQVLRNRLNAAFNMPISDDESLVYYNLMILRKDGEAKLFYVIDKATKSDVEQGIEKHWDKATTIGYDF
ncbi:hypothetical protein ACT4YI_16900 [Acinetobacter baumannii]